MTIAPEMLAVRVDPVSLGASEQSSEAPVISEDLAHDLGVLVDQDDRIQAKPLDDRAHISWGRQGGKFSVQGSVTRLGLTLGAVLSAMGIVVFNGHAVEKSYVPMAMVGGISLLISHRDQHQIGGDVRSVKR
jgi:hypothetical protein